MGRMINRVASEIRGRNSPHYKNHQANIKNGDVCVIVNIEDPLVTGKKLLFKKFRYHTGFVGHLKEFTYRHVLNTKPELLVFMCLYLVPFLAEKSYAQKQIKHAISIKFGSMQRSYSQYETFPLICTRSQDILNSAQS